MLGEWKKKGGISGTREELFLHMREIEGRSPFTFYVYMQRMQKNTTTQVCVCKNVSKRVLHKLKLLQ